jgi:hypothetical protein
MPKPRSRPIELDLPDGAGLDGIVAAFDVTMAAMAAGDITPDEALTVSKVLDRRRAAIEAKARLEKDETISHSPLAIADPVAIPDPVVTPDRVVASEPPVVVRPKASRGSEAPAGGSAFFETARAGIHPSESSMPAQRIAASAGMRAGYRPDARGYLHSACKSGSAAASAHPPVFGLTCIPPANRRPTARFAAGLLSSAAYPPVPLLYDASAAAA